jgi:hypothetical protein
MRTIVAYTRNANGRTGMLISSLRVNRLLRAI